MTRRTRSDVGSGSILAVGLIGATVALTMVAVPSYMALATRQAVIGAADAAALAAADTASGAVAGVPCDRARETAAANLALLEVCERDGYVVTVVVSRSIVGLRVRASATAGPPDSGTD